MNFLSIYFSRFILFSVCTDTIILKMFTEIVNSTQVNWSYCTIVHGCARARFVAGKKVSPFLQVTNNFSFYFLYIMVELQWENRIHYNSGEIKIFYYPTKKSSRKEEIWNDTEENSEKSNLGLRQNLGTNENMTRNRARCRFFAAWTLCSSQENTGKSNLMWVNSRQGYRFYRYYKYYCTTMFRAVILNGDSGLTIDRLNFYLSSFFVTFHGSYYYYF